MMDLYSLEDIKTIHPVGMIDNLELLIRSDVTGKIHRIDIRELTYDFLVALGGTEFLNKVSDTERAARETGNIFYRYYKTALIAKASKRILREEDLLRYVLLGFQDVEDNG